MNIFYRFWFFKFAAATAITVGAFFIPEGSFTTGKVLFYYLKYEIHVYNVKVKGIDFKWLFNNYH